MSQMIESFMNGNAGEGPCAQPLEFGEAGAGRIEAEPLACAANALHAIRIRLQVRVGEASMTVAQLLEAREHEVLVLDRTLEQPVDLTLEGRVVARGELVALDGAFAVRITELPVAWKL
jgi:flagellar motor switch protein FliN/FliY